MVTIRSQAAIKAPATLKSRCPYSIPIIRVRLVKDSSQKSPTNTVHTPADIVGIFRTYLGNPDREHLIVALLNTRNNVVGLHTVSIGTINSSLAVGREIFKAAILANSAAIILCHNHCSGDPTPSPEDIVRTRESMAVGQLLGIDVLDHIILGEGQSYTSLKEKGPWPSPGTLQFR